MEKTTKQEKIKQPIKKFRFGSMSATIWENETEEYKTYSVSLQRSYKDKDGNWQNTNSLNNNDIPKSILALQEAYRFINTPKEE